MAGLRERWFACTNALGWSAPSQWRDATVDEVCEVVCAGAGGVERALGRWAGARAAAGVGLAETLSDLAALYTAVAGLPDGEPGTSTARGPDGARLLRAVALAWTDVTCGELAETAAVDPLSGLASVRYLQTRLAEVYRAARARGRRVDADHALVVATMAVGGWARVAPLIAAGEAAAVVFDAGESLAAVGRGTVVVLAPREGLVDRARVLRGMLVRRLTPEVGVVTPPSVRIVALPARYDRACGLLDRLGGAAVRTDTGGG